MEKTVKKLYRGMAELRDYEVERCLKNGESVKIMYDGDYMTLSPEELTSKRIGTSKLIESVNGMKNYRLYGYAWEPVEIDY